MIHLTMNIPDNFEYKASGLVAFLKSLDYISSLSSATVDKEDFTLSPGQVSRLEAARNTPPNGFVSMDRFRESVKNKYGF